MPKSRVRKKKTGRPDAGKRSYSPRDPLLGSVLRERGWINLGAHEVADTWTYPPLAEATGMQTLIVLQPDGYMVDYFLENANEPFKSTLFKSREELVDKLGFLESWGSGIQDLRSMTGSAAPAR